MPDTTITAAAALAHAWTALQAIRLGSDLIDAMGKANPTKEQDEFGQIGQCDMDVATLDLIAGVLQEHAFAARLSVPEITMKLIRQHENASPSNYPGLEGTVLALSLAIREINTARNLLDDARQGESELDKMLLGAFAVVRSVNGFLESIVSGSFDIVTALEDVTAGRPVGPYDRARRLAHLDRLIAKYEKAEALAALASA